MDRHQQTGAVVELPDAGADGTRPRKRPRNRFIKVFRSAKQYRPEALFTTWLYRIVVNQCLDMRRKSARGPHSMDPEIIQPAGAMCRRMRLQAQERTDLVQRAVAELPEAQRAGAGAAPVRGPADPPGVAGAWPQ